VCGARGEFVEYLDRYAEISMTIDSSEPAAAARATRAHAVTVQFLGSGDAFGSGGRFQTCIAVTAGHERYLVDCGASSLIALRKFGVAPESITAIVLTHLHGDHFGGVPFFILDAQFYSKRTAPLVVAGPPGASRRITEALEVLFPGASAIQQKFAIEYVEWTDGVRARVGSAWVTPIAVNHVPATAPFAVRLECGGRTIAYSGDTEWTDALPRVAAGADLFLVEAVSFAKRMKYHLDYATLRAHWGELAAKRIVITHMGPEMLAQAGAVSCETAEDGKIVEL
jgi:ribonuclease BN (tRNA processing enzyme)